MDRTIYYLLSVFLLLPSMGYAEDQDCRTLYQNKQNQAALQACLPLAQQGDGESSFIISSLYSQGFNGGRADLDEALKWLTRSAEQGYGPACYNLATLYERGDIVSLDHEAAFRWYLRGAQQGHLASQLKTGIHYLKGTGVGRDLTQARHWLAIAANNGDLSAQITLGTLLKSSDPQQAIALLERAAEQGSSFAHYQLALLYREPVDEAFIDLDKALYHATESMRLGSQPAVDLAESLRQQIVIEESHKISNQAALQPSASETDVDVTADSHADAVNTGESAVKAETALTDLPVAERDNASVNESADDALNKPASEVGLHRVDWLKTQPENQYVLQLAQVSSEASVQSFLKSNQLEGKANYFRAVTAAGNMYVVLYAESSASLSGARAIAAQKLPEKLSGMVWYRKYRAVKNAYMPTD